MASTTTPAAPPSWRQRIVGSTGFRVELLLVLAVLCAVMAALSGAFLSVSNVLNILLSTSVFGVLAIGMTFVICSAGIDLSVGSMLALSGVVGAMLTSDLDLPWWVGIAGCLATGALTGAVNGFLVTKGMIPPFIVTLGMLGVARGVALVLSNGVSIYGLAPQMVWLGQGRPFGVPTPVIILLVTALVAHVLLMHTRFGVYAQVIGDNEGAARAMGVRVERQKVLLYTLSGLLSGLAGLLFAARINSGEPTAGINYELTAITATILGGTNLFGGRGSVIGTLIGALIMGVLQNGLNLLAVRPFYQQIAIGAVLILAVWLDRINSSGLAAMSFLELTDVRKTFGAIEALRGVTFSVEAGSVVGLVGDNGAGKSTLMKTITGVYRPDGGDIRFNGLSLVGKDPGAIREAGIEMIYQDLALAKMRDVASNIFLGRELTRSTFGVKLIDAKRMRAEAEAMIAKLGARIPSVGQMTGQLSGGQQQSVAIARALTFNPRLVIMDEPTAALAVREVEHVLDLIRTLKGHGIGVILISHRLTDVFSVCDRIVVLRQGAVIADDATRDTSMNAVVAHIVGATDAPRQGA